MAIEFNDNIHVKINRPTDFRFGPFTDINQANTTIPIAQRYHGLIFGVYTTPLSIVTSDIIYYYYWDGLGDNDIKPLVGSGSKWTDTTGGIYYINGIGVGTATLVPGRSGTFALDLQIAGLRAGRGAGNIISNTVLGEGVLGLNTTGFSIVALGQLSLSKNTVGYFNVGVGTETLKENVNGNFNLSLGPSSLQNNISGNWNTGAGMQSILSSDSSFNTGIGALSISNILTSSNYNAALGFRAGKYLTSIADIVGNYLTSANQSVFLGSETMAGFNSITNSIVIGYRSIGLGNNTTVVGNSSTNFGRWWGRLLLGTSVDSGDVLRVNGTVRLDLVTNSPGDFVTIDGINVLRRRTSAQVVSDLGISPSSYQRDLFTFSGTYTFTLTRNSPTAIQVFVNGQKIEYVFDWTISGNVVTVTTPLVNGQEISIEYFYSTPDVIPSNLNGTGVSNYITKWNTTTQLGVSLIQDNGSLVTLPAATDIPAVAATTDTDKFVVLDVNRFKFRTGAQLLSDIGAQASLTNPITGTGVSGQVAFWSAPSVQVGSNGLTWDNITGVLAVSSTLRVTGGRDTYSTGVSSIDIYRSAINVSPTAPFDQAGNLILQNRSDAQRGIFFVTGSTPDWRWSVTSTGILQSNGAQTIQTSTGALTLQSGNRNVLINTTTDAGFRLDVNGTARVQGALSSTGVNGTMTLSLGNVLEFGRNSDNYIACAGASSYLIINTGNAERWRILASGVMQSTGAQTIRTLTGDLTLATNGGNGNIILNPNGTGTVTITDAKDIALGTTTGTKIGTSTSQRIAFWNATPIVQPANTVAINDILVNLGLRASGGVSNFTSNITTSGNIEIGGQAYSPVNAKGNSGTGTVTFNWNDGNIQTVTLTGSCTFAFSNPQSGASYQIIITQDGTGGRTITWPTIHWESKSVPSLTGTANSKDILTITYDGTNYNAVMAKNFGTP